MKRVHIAAVVLLLLVWGVTPVMACLAPAQSLTPEESRCCKQMAGGCHQSAAKHPCCRQTQPESVASAATDARHGALVVAELGTSYFTAPAFAVPAQLAIAYFSPPHSPPLTASILRI